ncbi:MAG: UDP-N-acetylmuramoyl-tripeptide--D-alanyl-D-alanine ligase [Rickettsiales bacterium]|jgi:UDP-N-acetylmuramoyl-tripeptide--D-alanyl-D-alanine ligase|nr:UDP-N-acetylmuramoyl-tripeptide--D-alanyl-D-alanine ligase [Rickettsiales bacterium]
MQILAANIQFVILFCFAAFFIRRSLVLCLLYQQEEYDNKRFLKMVLGGMGFIDKKFTILSIITILIYSYSQKNLVFIGIYIAIFIYLIFQEFDPILAAKKCLVLTKRVKSILTICIILNAAIIAAMVCCHNLESHLVGYVLVIQFLPITLTLANILLMPYENYVQKKFYKEAKDILAQHNPKVIAITGSYGKTSTKYILNHILSSGVATLATPGSVNTVMGIVRVIRERLKWEHKYFIVEMGAYGVGSIKRLCELAPPNYGIITSIGVAHFERYKSRENVARAKFELSDYVARALGDIILNRDKIPAKYIAKYNQVSSEHSCYVGSSINPGDFQIRHSQNTIEGISFELLFNEDTFFIKAPIYGLQQVENIALSFVLAMRLGLKSDLIIASLAKLPQTPHRLEVKRQGSNIIIDDAYNSNPDGFKAALDVLDMFGRGNSKGRRIVVTPGMVEMGAKHDDEHRNLGEIMASRCDILVAVLPERITALTESFAKHAPDKVIKLFPNFKLAKAWLDSNIQGHDIVLFENDLPDIYETKIRF